MYEQKCRIKDLTRTLSGDYILSLTASKSFLQYYDDFADKDLRIILKPYRKKRSLDANAYFWVLCSKLAEATGVTKTEVYKQSILNIGGNSETLCGQTEAVENICKLWEATGLGWLTETFESKLDGCTNVILYKGSSAYDTKQMSRLIENVVQDCKAVGIETMPPEELKRLIERWDKNG
ncbi:MAG TPA: hypothetical protein VFD25_01490 [Clostridia bacterium]|nr:hypothetical protein [Clostridia bacterium]